MKSTGCHYPVKTLTTAINGGFVERNTAGLLWYGKVMCRVRFSFFFVSNLSFWGGGVGEDGKRTGGLAVVKWY